MNTQRDNAYYLEMDDLRQTEDKIRFLYAFLASGEFFHQEISIYDPRPSQASPPYAFNGSIFPVSHANDKDGKVALYLTIRDRIMKAKAPVICTGSHKKDIDKAIQIILLPESMVKESKVKIVPEKLLLIRFLVNCSDSERQNVVNLLLDEYKSFGKEKRLVCE